MRYAITISVIIFVVQKLRAENYYQKNTQSDEKGVIYWDEVFFYNLKSFNLSFKKISKVEATFNFEFNTKIFFLLNLRSLIYFLLK